MEEKLNSWNCHYLRLKKLKLLFEEEKGGEYQGRENNDQLNSFGIVCFCNDNHFERVQ